MAGWWTLGFVVAAGIAGYVYGPDLVAHIIAGAKQGALIPTL